MMTIDLAKDRGSLPLKDEIASSLRSYSVRKQSQRRTKAVLLSRFCEESFFNNPINKILHFVQDDKSG
ncbi:MAG: hypothetical protein RBS09_03450 [Anaerolineaceae bacterium]|nr:hypothetical protein [Anaerolineaceae bacterium]